MRINDLIDILEGTREEYGNAEVILTDVDNPAEAFIIKNVAVEDQDADDAGSTGIVFINGKSD